MRFSGIVLSLFLLPYLFVSSASAQHEQAQKAPWERSCGSFASPRNFVKDSSYYCLRQRHQKSCERQAREFFDKCQYRGDYERISARIHAKMLFVFALATSGPVAEGGKS